MNWAQTETGVSMTNDIFLYCFLSKKNENGWTKIENYKTENWITVAINKVINMRRNNEKLLAFICSVEKCLIIFPTHTEN